MLTENHEASVAALRNFFSTLVIGNIATGQAHTMTMGKDRMADQHKINVFIVCATLRILEGEEWKFWVKSTVQ